MGIRVVCPNGHRLHLKSFLAGRKGVCPDCAARFRIPEQSSDLPQPELEAKNEPSEYREPAGHVAEHFNLFTQPSFSQSLSSSNESDQEIWYVHAEDGQQYGPANNATFEGWVTEGRVTEDCLIWRDGWPEWRSGSTVLQQLIADNTISEPTSVASQDSLASTQLAGQDPQPLPKGYQAYKRRKSSSFDLVMTIVLALVAIILFVGLFIVLQNGDLTFGPARN